jgi:hypothetical protein
VHNNKLENSVKERILEEEIKLILLMISTRNWDQTAARALQEVLEVGTTG